MRNSTKPCLPENSGWTPATHPGKQEEERRNKVQGTLSSTKQQTEAKKIPTADSRVQRNHLEAALGVPDPQGRVGALSKSLCAELLLLGSY